MMKLKFEDVAELVSFLKDFTRGERVLFQQEEPVEVYNGRGRNYTYPSATLHGTFTFDRGEKERAIVSISLVPTPPKGWEHVPGQRLQQMFGSRADLLEQLIALGVGEDQLKQLKFRVSQLRELIDSSTRDVEERTERNSKAQTDYAFKGKDEAGDVVTYDLKIAADLHSRSALLYTLSRDFSKGWQLRNSQVLNALTRAEFRIIRASFSATE